MSRKELFVNTHVFHASLRFKTSILADEKDKKIFLDFALQSQEDFDFMILSFVILDNEAQFLAAFPKGKTEAKKMMRMLMKDYRNFLKNEYCQKNDRNMLQVEWETVENKECLLELCKNIHLLPVECGYVKQARDYWWSSFQSYRGVYYWKGLDVRAVLEFLAFHGKSGRNHFLRLHRQES